MKLGFFAGIGGNAAALSAVLELVADCDRIVSLGDLVGGTDADDARCFVRVAGNPRLLLLAGQGERRRAHDPRIPDQLRDALRAMSPATVESGVAIIGSCLSPSAPASRALGGAPHLVAPIEVAAAPSGMRVWRSVAGGLARVSDLAVPMSLRSAERLRVDVGPAGPEGSCVVLDLDKRTLEVRRKPARRVRRRVVEKVGDWQQRLAV